MANQLREKAKELVDISPAQWVVDRLGQASSTHNRVHAFINLVNSSVKETSDYKFPPSSTTAPWPMPLMAFAFEAPEGAHNSVTQ